MTQLPVIGYDELRGRPNYATARNCYAPTPGYRHRRVSRLPLDALSRHGGTSDGIFVPARPVSVQGMHLWNKVSLGRSPFGVSFESVLPRVLRADADSRQLRVLRHVLMSGRCRFLAPCSEWARDLFLGSVEARHRRVLEDKTFVIPPYQAVDEEAEPVEGPRRGERLELLFVGGEFFRKGGEALLAVLAECGEELDLHLTVVSRCDGNDYATPWVSSADVGRARSRLAADPRITWFSSLPNAEVRALARTTHVGVLPTMAETYGYSLLEVMAAGRPVIGTTVQAGPEIVTDDRGWRLELERRPDGLWRGRSGTDFAYELGVLSLSAQLTSVLRSIRADPASVGRRGAAAREHVRNHHQEGRAGAMASAYRLFN